KREQVAFTARGPGRGSRGLSQRRERRLALRLVAAAADAVDARDLALAHRGVVDREDVDVIGVLRPVLVDADNGFLAAVDARLTARGAFLDAQLGQALLDRLGHAAERLDLGDELHGLGGDRVRQAFDVVAAAERVDDLRDAALLRDDQLGVA